MTMLLSSNKVAHQGLHEAKHLEEVKTLVNTLSKVVACYRQLSSCVGGSTDSTELRCELRQTRERAQGLALACRHSLTARLRDKSVAQEERRETELLWVAFSSSLELFHTDMCKVYQMGRNFSLASKDNTFVKTGIQGETDKVAARALSLTELNRDHAIASVERLEEGDLCVETARVDEMLEDMEQKVNVLWWVVEARGPQHPDPVSTDDSYSVTLLAGEEDSGGWKCERSQLFVLAVISTVAAFAVLLSVYVTCLI